MEQSQYIECWLEGDKPLKCPHLAFHCFNIRASLHVRHSYETLYIICIYFIEDCGKTNYIFTYANKTTIHNSSFTIPTRSLGVRGVPEIYISNLLYIYTD